MSDDFASMFTYRGSLKEDDVIDISDDDDEIIEESFEIFDSKKKRRPTLMIGHHDKKIKNSNDSNSQNTHSSIESKNSISLDDEFNEEDENSFNVNNNNRNNNNNNNYNNNKNKNGSHNIKRQEVYSIEEDDDALNDEAEFTAPPVYTKSSVSNFIKKQQPLQSQTNTTTTTTTTAATGISNINNNNNNNNNNSYTNYTPSKNYYDNSINNNNNMSNSPSNYSSPQATKRVNDPIPLIIKCAGEPNEKILFYYDSPLQKLINLYCTKKNLDVNTAQFKLYGLMLDSNKTPRDLDLLDDDTLEVGIKISKPINLPIMNNSGNNINNDSSTAAAIPVDDGSPKVLLQVRYENVLHKFKIGMSDPYSKLIIALTKKLDLKIPAGRKIVFKFDGDVLNPSSTPQDDEMEDDYQIDAFLK